MAIKKVDGFPAIAGRGRAAAPVFTDSEVEQMKAEPQSVWQVATNINTAQRYAKFCQSDKGAGFIYSALNSGKTRKNRDGKDVPTYDVYVSYDPEKADERAASRKATAAKS